jgi:ABC-type transport system involved in cytochrome c biogenesis permease subunit
MDVPQAAFPVPTVAATRLLRRWVIAAAIFGKPMFALSQISITCFAASYAVAWALEVSRLVFRSRARRAIMLGFAAAGLLAHTLFLAFSASVADGAPLASSFDWTLVAAWLLVAIYFYLCYYYPQAAIGLFVFPLVLALIAAAALFADRAPIASVSASRAWGAIHGVFLLLGTVAVMVGFVAGSMYLLQAYRLKHKLPPMQGLRLPSLEWLEAVNSRSLVLSTLLVSIGFLAGVILRSRSQPGSLPWSDPVVWSSALMLLWLVVASVFNAVYKPARRGRKVAYLTIVSFVFVAFALGVLLLVDTQHAPKTEPRRLTCLEPMVRFTHPAIRGAFPVGCVQRTTTISDRSFMPASMGGAA